MRYVGIAVSPFRNQPFPAKTLAGTAAPVSTDAQAGEKEESGGREATQSQRRMTHDMEVTRIAICGVGRSVQRSKPNRRILSVTWIPYPGLTA